MSRPAFDIKALWVPHADYEQGILFAISGNRKCRTGKFRHAMPATEVLTHEGWHGEAGMSERNGLVE
jgi:hypothetical protein